MKRKSHLSIFIIAVCIMMLMGGCGADEEAAPVPNENSVEATQREVYETPPQIELFLQTNKEASITLPASSYTWNCQIGDDQMVGGVADAPHPMEMDSPLVDLAGSALEADYGFSVPAAPDELTVREWELADIGNSNAPGLVIASYYREETESEDLTVTLKSGKVYEFFMEWKKERLAETGFYGVAYYVCKTAIVPDVQEEIEVAGKEEIISFLVTKPESGEEEERGVYSSDSGFQEVMGKYAKLDVYQDENQYPGEDFRYILQFLDLDGQTLQTIEFEDDSVLIDGVRYRDNGTGSVGELFLAIDELFEEEGVPEATFGEVYTGEIGAIDGVEMTVSYATPKGANLIIISNAEQEITFGADYELQVKEDGEWRSVDYIIDNAAFNSIGYIGEKGKPWAWKVKWTYFYGILPDGDYRITKTALKDGEAGEYTKYILAAEFSVG